MEHKISVREETRSVKCKVLTVNGVDIPIGDEDIGALMDNLCRHDGYFAIRCISDDPTVAAMIKAGLVKHSYRGCYASPLLHELREQIWKVYVDSL